MIEITVLSYLGDHLTVPVYAERPENPVDSYVLIERTSSSKSNHISTAMIAVQCYARSLLGAATLCENVIKAMEDITDLAEVSRCEPNSAYNFTDTATKEYRYQAVFDLTYFE